MSNINKKIEEIQVLEHHLQNLLAQKQSIQIELNEINNAIEELKKSDDEVYRIISGMMLKSDKKKLEKELLEKKKLAEMKIESIEKQEKLVENKSDELKKETSGTFLKGKKESK